MADRMISNKIMDLNRLSTQELLRTRFCDLPITIKGSLVEKRAQQVFKALSERGIMVNPSIWLSEEWFNPEGVVGFAIPFYLVHPRLISLERRLMLEAEGVTENECLRILRHETGHAIDEAFQLHRTSDYRRVFGPSRKLYPTAYPVTPQSRDFVQHLNAWYAQAHPVEDFAETFAVWLRPRRVWRQQYRDWPALQKLEAVDRWMTECAKRTPALKVRRPVAKLANIRRTLGEHYEEKRAFYGVGQADELDVRLRQIFPEPPEAGRSTQKSAVGILRAIRMELREEVAGPLGVPAYAVDQVLRQVIQRAKVLNLRHTRPNGPTVKDLRTLVSGATIDLIKTSPRLPL